MRRDDTKGFDYNLDYSVINFREHPELYRVGKGEQGVLLVEPYKSEILPFWRFKTPEMAQKSANTIYKLFLRYKSHRDFVGMDMARKFLQMGYTRSRRYANHPSGRKYETNPQKAETSNEQLERRKKILPQAEDWDTNDKAISAQIFYNFYTKANSDEVYKLMKAHHLSEEQM